MPNVLSRLLAFLSKGVPGVRPHLLNWSLSPYKFDVDWFRTVSSDVDVSLLGKVLLKYDVDFGWRLSEDRESVTYELYLYKKGATAGGFNPSFQHTVVCDPRPLQGSLAHIFLKGFPGPEGWHESH